MEVLVILALVAIGTIWYFNAKGSKTTAEPEAAPYKVETPTLSEMAEKAEVVGTKPAAKAHPAAKKAPVKRAASVKAKAPAVRSRSAKSSAPKV